MPLRIAELSNKQTRTGEPGIFFCHKWRALRTKNTKENYFRITAPGLLRTLYVGNESTWESHYDKKLAEALTIRREWVRGMLAS